jgi:hypothetical protein
MRRPRPSAMSLTLWSECEEARLASCTPRLTNIGLRLHPRGTRSCTTVVPDFSEGWAQALAAVSHQDRHHQRFARGSHLRYQSHKPAGECGHNRSHRPNPQLPIVHVPRSGSLPAEFDIRLNRFGGRASASLRSDARILFGSLPASGR